MIILWYATTWLIFAYHGEVNVFVARYMSMILLGGIWLNVVNMKCDGIEFVVVSVYVLWTWVGPLGINNIIFVSKCGCDVWWTCQLAKWPSTIFNVIKWIANWLSIVRNDEYVDWLNDCWLCSLWLSRLAKWPST